MSKSTELLMRFQSLKCAPDIIYKLGKLDLKEITECYGMVLFMKQFPVWNMENMLCFDVGCGKRPTLGILLAHLRKWHIASVDPNVEMKRYYTNDFTVTKERLVDIKFSNYYVPLSLPPKEVVLCANHSHHTLEEIDTIWLHTSIHYFVNPCCIDNLPKNLTGSCYVNTKIWSDKNKLYYFYLQRKISNET